MLDTLPFGWLNLSLVNLAFAWSRSKLAIFSRRFNWPCDPLLKTGITYLWDYIHEIIYIINNITFCSPCKEKPKTIVRITRLPYQLKNQYYNHQKMKKTSSLRKTIVVTKLSIWLHLRCVSKNIPNIFDCNFKKSYQILVISDVNIPDTTCHQMTVQLSTSPNVSFCTTKGMQTKQNMHWNMQKRDKKLPQNYRSKLQET